MELLLYLGGGAGAVGALAYVVRGAWRLNRRVVLIADTVTELLPNGGESFRDKTIKQLGDLCTAVKAVEQAQRDHLVQMHHGEPTN